jgi:hypothetical protein
MQWSHIIQAVNLHEFHHTCLQQQQQQQQQKTKNKKKKRKERKIKL